MSSKFGEKFDAKATAQVLRKAGYATEAASLAERYGESELYLRILLEDLHDWERALTCISQLPFLQSSVGKGHLELKEHPLGTSEGSGGSPSIKYFSLSYGLSSKVGIEQSKVLV